MRGLFGSVSRKKLEAASLNVGDEGEVEIERIEAQPTVRLRSRCLDRARPAGGRLMARLAERTEPILHNRLAVLRAERGLSRQELADALGVNYQTIGYLERSEYNPSLDLALRTAEYFGLPVEAIFSRRPLVPMSAQLYPTAPAGQPTDSEPDGGDR